jgi:hypothetical protein
MELKIKVLGGSVNSRKVKKRVNSKKKEDQII